ncbi:MAG: glutathione synthase [Deltaproteobacteria bacterium]|nr:glutathione synthase [Deltaproteobacteria bacterium]MBW2131835.1 glutathione synthase [Deltaproteobacteria bacterium]
MILSFHPCYEGDVNRLCAGRDPGPEELAFIQRASAVILPQGCRESLYRMAAAHCPNVFPNYEVRFAFPGKTDQIRLFRRTGFPHPRSEIFSSVADFFSRYGDDGKGLPFSFPLVFKWNWGGEGASVFRVDSLEALKDMLLWEKGSGSDALPFLIQEFLPGGNRSLRVAVIGDALFSYWRIQPDPGRFLTNVSAGGIIDDRADPELQDAGRTAVRDFCGKTGINLAGIDLLFRESAPDENPFFLEINYFFGRKGLGGSERYYGLLAQAIDRWLSRLNLKRGITHAGTA